MTAPGPPTASPLVAFILLAQGCADITVVACADHDASPFIDATHPTDGPSAVNATDPRDAAPGDESASPPPQDASADGPSTAGDGAPITDPPPPASDVCVQLPNCRPGYLCPPDPTTTRPDPSAPPAPPELTEVVATRDREAVTISVTGTDPNGDPGALVVDTMDDGGRPYTPTSAGYSSYHEQGVRFRRTTTLYGYGIRRVRVTVSDLASNRATRVVQVVPRPVLAEGVACDFQGARDRCFAGGVCRPPVNDGAARCVRGTPPIVRSAEIFYNAVDGRAEMRIALREVDHGRVYLSLQVFDVTGRRRPEFEPASEVEAGSRRLEPADRAICDRAVRWGLSGFTAHTADLRATPPSSLRFVARLRDEEGLVTEVRDFALRPTITAGEGEPCDDAWVERRCDRAAGLACVRRNCGDAPNCAERVCARPPWSCPSAALVDLNARPLAGAVDTWRVEGAIADDRLLGLVACQFGEFERDRAHRFRAPRAGRWRFTASVREGAVQLGAVAACGDPAWGNLLFCAGGEAVATQDYTLRAGEEIAVSVARSPLEADMAYALTVSPAP